MVHSEQLRKMAGSDCVKEKEPMCAHTTFRIGGAADYFVEIHDEKVLAKILCYCRQQGLPYFILGNGSNLLVSDAGYRGVMISTRGFSRLEFQGEEPVDGQKEAMSSDGQKVVDGTKQIVCAGSGVMLSAFAMQVAQRGLAGFEFAGGIPGTLGGAVAMNAGAYGGEIKNVIQSARVLLQDGTICSLTKEELKLSYRHSIIQEQNMIVLDSVFAFEPGDKVQIQEQMKELNRRRKEKQPLEYASAGSTFKRPEGYFAGKLIEDAGLRGYRVGDVMVSKKHCGFVVNVGKGTCEQAMAVIGHVQETVMKKFGIMLELEVRTV